MEFLSELWAPILLSAVFVWLASAIMHMVLPHHKGEFGGLPDEEKFVSAMEGVPPGQYMFPWGDFAYMKSPEYVEKAKRGPNGTLYILPGPFNMGRNLVLTLLQYVVVGIFIAYVLWNAFGPGNHRYLDLFQVAGAAAFLCYGLGWMPHMIWYGEKGFWANMFDGIVYSLITAGTFAWLWPGRVG